MYSDSRYLTNHTPQKQGLRLCLKPGKDSLKRTYKPHSTKTRIKTFRSKRICGLAEATAYKPHSTKTRIKTSPSSVCLKPLKVSYKPHSTKTRIKTYMITSLTLVTSNLTNHTPQKQGLRPSLKIAFTSSITSLQTTLHKNKD